MTNHKTFFTSSSHAVVCMNSYFIDSKTQKVVQLGKSEILTSQKKIKVILIGYV